MLDLAVFLFGFAPFIESRIRESNPPIQLGKLAPYR